jgi:hypothetical protein
MIQNKYCKQVFYSIEIPVFKNRFFYLLVKAFLRILRWRKELPVMAVARGKK